MVISPSKNIDVAHVIDTLETLDTNRIEVKYPADVKGCTVRFMDSKLKLIIMYDEIRVMTNNLASPNELAEAFLNSGKELKELAGSPVLLLN